MALTYIFIHLLFANLAIWRLWGTHYNTIHNIDKRDIIIFIIGSWVLFIMGTFFYFKDRDKAWGSKRFFKFSPKNEL